ncbi:hypothetical protein [Microcoleus sp. FACHB-831]|uniref:DUF7219 family protein n=1 Tax=Microcoleus sp. FACHB-831 TaxID=2692827 RepID=UPI001686D3DE|nr:hypothetical protein [Microcoleus sp. FACHB-831]
MVHQSEYLYSQISYYKELKSKNLLFNTKLQELARQVGLISYKDKEKIPLLEAYRKIAMFWEELEQTKQ